MASEASYDCSSASKVTIKIEYVLTNHMNPMETRDDVVKWKHFPRYWPFVRENHRSPVFSLIKGQ